MKTQTIISALYLSTLTLILSTPAPGTAKSGPGSYGNINTVYSCSRDEDTINLRSRAGQQYQVIKKIPSGKLVVLIGNTIVSGNFTWQKVNFLGTVGWVRGDFLCN